MKKTALLLASLSLLFVTSVAYAATTITSKSSFKLSDTKYTRHVKVQNGDCASVTHLACAGTELDYSSVDLTPSGVPYCYQAVLCQPN